GEPVHHQDQLPAQRRDELPYQVGAGEVELAVQPVVELLLGPVLGQPADEQVPQLGDLRGERGHVHARRLGGHTPLRTTCPASCRAACSKVGLRWRWTYT